METFASSASSLSISRGSDEPHVLAVDDNLVEKLLKKSSCKVTTAEDGLGALEYLGLGAHHDSSTNCKGSKVNMIITDYCMPGMTRYELLKKIKRESSIMKDVPVVIVSSENIPTRINHCDLILNKEYLCEVDRCMEEGAQIFMVKPLKHSDVERLRCQIMQC